MIGQFSSILLLTAVLTSAAPKAEPLKVGVFAVDATPPVGSPLAYDPTKGVCIRSVAGESC